MESIERRQPPVPHSQEEIELLVSLARNITDFPRMNLSEQDSLLYQLEAYECHAQIVKLLEWRIQHGQLTSTQAFADYIWLMRIQYLGLEKFSEFVYSAKKCISSLSLSFPTVRLHIAEEILGSENFEEQGQFYRNVLDSIPQTAQKVLLLERLALIYEKKLFRESDVEPVYRQILGIDPYNVKALRFFKLWYAQLGKWEEAAQQLSTLIVASKNPHERQRAAHEMAQIHLYNLNQPAEAREIIIEYCANSQLDTRQTFIEALERLEAFEELLEYLSQTESLVKENEERAFLRLKQGLVCLKASRMKDAILFFKDSIKFNQNSLLAYEALVNALIDTDNAKELVDTLNNLSEIVAFDSSRKAISEILKRAEPSAISS
jgi:hypothetical protein